MRQRKIDNAVLKQMIDEGKQQRECAAFFGVSDAAISKVVRRWELEENIPESLKKLTPKQQKFALAVASGKSRTSAAFESFESESLNSSRVMACKLMRDPDITLAISDLMAQEGLSRRFRIKRLSDIVNAKDLAIASRGLDLSFKLDGSYAPEKVDVMVYDAKAVSAAVAEVRELLKQQQAEEAKTIDITTNREEE